MALACLSSINKARDRVEEWKRNGLAVGLVPTMGALHEGHLNLVRGSVSECDRTVVSVFVNPTQFGEGEDYHEYPRQLEDDAGVLQTEGADMLFCPAEETMYPPGHCTYVVQENLTEKLCGKYRPGHFRGVCTIVLKLLNVIPAQRAYFGRKDFQQSVVIQRMVSDLDVPTNVRVLPTVREKDGLALSSRNEYLTEDERSQAVCLYRALKKARSLFRDGMTSRSRIVEAMREVVEGYPLADIQYVEVVDPKMLETPEKVKNDSVAAVAVHIGDTRLIDNMPLGSCEDIFLDKRNTTV